MLWGFPQANKTNYSTDMLVTAWDNLFRLVYGFFPAAIAKSRYASKWKGKYRKINDGNRNEGQR